jgi:hypothetical protein
MAACYAFAGERGDFWRLQSALAVEAEILRKLRGWPIEVVDLQEIERPYLQHLAKLVLDEDTHPNVFSVCPRTLRDLFGYLG